MTPGVRTVVGGISMGWGLNISSSGGGNVSCEKMSDELTSLGGVAIPVNGPEVRRDPAKGATATEAAGAAFWGGACPPVSER